MAMSESLRKQIADLVASNRVVLFMKGTPGAPQCQEKPQVTDISVKLFCADTDYLNTPRLTIRLLPT